MKIALVVPGFSSDERDWCIPALLDFVRVLAARAEVHVFALRYPHRLDRYPVYGATVHSLNGVGAGGLGSPRLWARAVRAIALEDARGRFDVLHAFWAYEPGPAAAWAGRRLGVPVVISLAGGELARLPSIGYGLQLQAHRRLFIRWALRRSQVVTAGSRYLQMQARPIVKDVAWTPLGVDTTRFTPLLPLPSGRGARGVGGDRGVGTLGLHVASLMPVKGHAVLLQALAEASRECPDLHLALAGADSGGLRPALERQAAQLGVGERLEFLGELPHEALPVAYCSARFCVQASWHEAQGVAALEAAACGVPTLGTAAGLLPELMPAEWLAPQGDAPALAALLIRAAKRPQAPPELGQALRAKVENLYSLEVCVTRFQRIYEMTVGRG